MTATIAITLGVVLLLPAAAGAQAGKGETITLPPAQAAGNPYCLDPDSERLRTILKQRRPDASTKLEGRALADDVAYLHQAMRTQYVGYAEMLHQREFDPDRFFTGWVDRLRGGPKQVTFAEGVIAPLVELRRSFVDVHLQISGAPNRFAAVEEVAFNEYQAPWPAGLQPEALQGCVVGTDASRVTLRRTLALQHDGRPEWRISVSAQGSGATRVVRCGEEAITLSRRQNTWLGDGGPVYEWREAGEAGIVRIRQLHGSAEDRRLLEQVAKDYDRHRRKRLLIFDLRGNGGGNDGYVLRWVKQARRGEWTLFQGSLTFDGPLDRCTEWNDLVLEQLAEGRADGEQSRSERAGLRASWPAQPAPARDYVHDGRMRSDGKHPYTGQVVALINRSSASSGEGSAEILQRSLGAVIIGERSMGALQYGNVRSLLLPGTGLRATVPTRRFFYDRDAVEGVGIPVDAYLDDLAPSAEDLLPHLRQLLKLLRAERARAPEQGRPPRG